ncbi:NnrS family protein [Myxococcota bacterium]|nr:NnrS family protein [Myxococcota bacterium]
MRRPERGPPTGSRAIAATAAQRSWRPVRFGLVANAAVGSALGAVALLPLRWGWAGMGPAWVQVHAYAQVFGFVLPVAVGMGFRLLPPAPWFHLPRVENACFALLLSGVVARFGAQAALAAGAESGWTAVLARCGDGAVLAGVALFVAAAWKGIQRRRTLTLSDRLAQAALLWLGIAAALELWAGWALGPGAATAPQDRIAAVYAAVLDGFAPCLILTVMGRMAAATVGRPLPVGWPAVAVAAGLQAGAAASVAGAALGEPGLGAAGAAAVSAALLVPAVALASGGVRSPVKDEGVRRTVTVAFAWLGVASALRLGGAGAALARVDAPPLLGDAARHTFTIGFLTVLILGMLQKLAPAFETRDLALPGWVAPGRRLLSLAVALRLLELLPFSWARTLAGVSGGVAWAGVLVGVVPPLATLRAPKGRRAVLPPAEWRREAFEHRMEHERERRRGRGTREAERGPVGNGE